MNARQQSQLKMFLATNLVLTQNEGLWKTIKLFAEAQKTLQGNLSTIESFSVSREKSTLGKTEDKGGKKESLVLLSAQVAAAIRSYATSTNNQELKKQARYKEGQLRRMSDNKLCNVASLLHSLTQGIESELTDSVSAEELKELATKCTAYAGTIPVSRVDNAKRKTIGENLRKTIQDTNTLLNDTLDDLMVPFASKQPDFHAHYHTARKVIPTGGGGKQAPTLPKNP